MAGFGRYGPYVEHDGKYAKIDADEVFNVGLNRAVTAIAEAKNGGRGRNGAQKQAPLKELGEHPELGGKIEVLSGRYGPYIKFGKVNVTLPKDLAPENVTTEDAVRLIAARAENGGAKPKRGQAKSAKSKAEAANGKTATAKAAEAGGKPKSASRKTKSKQAAEAT
jgi:DNA topoisomerase-1